MLSNNESFSSFSVNDLAKAKEFYSQTLRLKVSKGTMGTLSLQTGGAQPIVIYPKADHIPATFTVLNFYVDDIVETVKQLVGRGVPFEHYEGDLKTDEQGIFRGDGPLIAWFKDPAGNILSVIEKK
ncbi:MAG TPA: VOC family protein [Balneolaceae bacterium]|nr:VOC family protein [Balneolaceae bacterium]